MGRQETASTSKISPNHAGSKVVPPQIHMLLETQKESAANSAIWHSPVKLCSSTCVDTSVVALDSLAAAGLLLLSLLREPPHSVACVLLPPVLDSSWYSSWLRPACSERQTTHRARQRSHACDSNSRPIVTIPTTIRDACAMRMDSSWYSSRLRPARHSSRCVAAAAHRSRQWHGHPRCLATVTL